MGDKEFKVSIEDEDGKMVVNETLKSHSNGFIDLWLPRDQSFKTKIEYDGKIVEGELSTFEGDNTCITTMQLQ